eukprot:1179225-Prorocentrum_minimum.AAC.2
MESGRHLLVRLVSGALLGDSSAPGRRLSGRVPRVPACWMQVGLALTFACDTSPKVARSRYLCCARKRTTPLEVEDAENCTPVRVFSRELKLEVEALKFAMFSQTVLARWCRRGRSGLLAKRLHITVSRPSKVYSHTEGGSHESCTDAVNNGVALFESVPSGAA